MAIYIKSLAQGTIITYGAPPVDLYTVPAGRSALINNIRLVNLNGATTDAMNLYVKPAASAAKRIHTKDFTIAANTLLPLEDVVTLGAADKIQLNIPGPQTPSLAYQINGIEKE